MKGIAAFLLLQIIFILYANKMRLSSKFKLTINKIAMISSVLLYVTIIGAAIYFKLKYQQELDAFDTNKDGFFNGDEINAAQIKAMRNVTNDTGRNFAPFTGIVIAVLYYLLLLPILIIIDKVNSKHTLNIKP